MSLVACLPLILIGLIVSHLSVVESVECGNPNSIGAYTTVTDANYASFTACTVHYGLLVVSGITAGHVQSGLGGLTSVAAMTFNGMSDFNFVLDKLERINMTLNVVSGSPGNFSFIPGVKYIGNIDVYASTLYSMAGLENLQYLGGLSLRSSGGSLMLLENLDVLSTAVKGGAFVLRLEGLSNLRSIKGMQGLTTADVTLRNMNYLRNLNGLESLTSCQSLVLDGLATPNLTALSVGRPVVNRDLYVGNMVGLTTLQDLSGITFTGPVAGSAIRIERNAMLRSLSGGLQNVAQIGQLQIILNPRLTVIDGLSITVTEGCALAQNEILSDLRLCNMQAVFGPLFLQGYQLSCSGLNALALTLSGTTDNALTVPCNDQMPFVDYRDCNRPLITAPDVNALATTVNGLSAFASQATQWVAKINSSLAVLEGCACAQAGGVRGTGFDQATLTTSLGALFVVVTALVLVVLYQ